LRVEMRGSSSKASLSGERWCLAVTSRAYKVRNFKHSDDFAGEVEEKLVSGSKNGHNCDAVISTVMLPGGDASLVVELYLDDNLLT